MGLITPDYGLLFWMLVSFSILLVILRKFAWKPIMQGIRNREEKIAKALRDADYARNEIAKLEERNDELIAKAQATRDSILAEAKKTKERIIEEARVKSQEETQKFLNQAQEQIKREQEIAKLEFKSYATQLVIQISEKIIRQELHDKAKYEEQINSIIQELSSQN
ncbi:MAG: F0F1 ATP synthase subunit B [Perlabentimonas sp.]